MILDKKDVFEYCYQMKNEIPTGLRAIRAFAYLGLFFSVIGLFALSAIVQNPIVLMMLIAGFIFYIALIIAITKRNKTLFIVCCVMTAIAILTSIALLFILKAPHTAVRILIEIALLSYLWKNKKYFSV